MVTELTIPCGNAESVNILTKQEMSLGTNLKGIEYELRQEFHPKQLHDCHPQSWCLASLSAIQFILPVSVVCTKNTH